MLVESIGNSSNGEGASPVGRGRGCRSMEVGAAPGGVGNVGVANGAGVVASGSED